MGHLQQAGHDSLADADGEMPAPVDVPLRGRAGPEQRAGLEHGRPEPAGHGRRDCLYPMNVIGRMMSVDDRKEADVMSMADRPAASLNGRALGSWSKRSSSGQPVRSRRCGSRWLG